MYVSFVLLIAINILIETYVDVIFRINSIEKKLNFANCDRCTCGVSLWKKARTPPIKIRAYFAVKKNLKKTFLKNKT